MSNSTDATPAANPTKKQSSGTTVLSVSGITTALIAVSKIFWAEEQLYLDAASFCAPVLAGIIVYFGSGFISMFGFEDEETATKRRKYNKDLKFIQKQLKQDLPEETRKMLQEQQHETLQCLASLSR